MKKDYYLIDYAKLFFAFCIVAIHTSLLKNCPDSFAFWVNQLVFRVAVPFFFVSSGVFLAKKLERVAYDAKESSKIVFAYCKRLAVLFLVFEPILLLCSVCANFYRGLSVTDIALNSLQHFFFYPGALWFIQACFVGALLLLVFLKIKCLKLAFFISAFLYICSLFFDSYGFLLEKNSLLNNVVDGYLNIFLTARNGFFVGFFYIMLGFLCNRLSNVFSKAKLGAFTALMFVLYIVELNILKHFSAYPSKDDFSLFLFVPFCAFFLVLFFLQYSKKPGGNTYCRNLSTGVYLLHGPVCFFVSRFFTHILNMEGGSVFFLVVCIICVSICMWSYKTNNRIAYFLR